MYDAELFGHCGLKDRIYKLSFQKMHYDQNTIKPITQLNILINSGKPGAYTFTSSWGDKGYYEVWLNCQMIIFTTHKAADRMVEMAVQFQMHRAF